MSLISCCTLFSVESTALPDCGIWAFPFITLGSCFDQGLWLYHSSRAFSRRAVGEVRGFLFQHPFSQWLNLSHIDIAFPPARKLRAGLETLDPMQKVRGPGCRDPAAHICSLRITCLYSQPDWGWASGGWAFRGWISYCPPWMAPLFNLLLDLPGVLFGSQMVMHLCNSFRENLYI